MEIDTGDVVYHKPTGEEWVVAYVRDDRLAWLGWPSGTAHLSDCTLIEKVSAEVRLRTLRDMERSGDSRFADHARRELMEIPA